MIDGFPFPPPDPPDPADQSKDSCWMLSWLLLVIPALDANRIW